MPIGYYVAMGTGGSVKFSVYAVRNGEERTIEALIDRGGHQAWERIDRKDLFFTS